ncbi:acyl-CoA dehydrogenase family protein [Pandoraea bronchicola]|uniref:Acyl-CoA dehydrogenase n=1 Tax=Pandoraea bronchicola TaxID=2508287 RepID=A0A5E5BZS3_9BURK|nr:acyl-CoA dehydrogenase family protein [Pandoraea bronchicola]VVE89840.1 acyl-CoA dehydrogenase [Pandoraea bronchicola]
MDFTESDDIRALRDTLRRFVEKEMPRDRVAQWDKTNTFPRDVFDKLAGLGVLGLTVPEAYGGLGRDIVGAMVVIEELARRSLAVAIPYINAACYAGMNIDECGTEAQKAQILPRVVEGKMIFAYGWTEPDVGSDLASIRTRAERRGDRIVVNGAKRFCSGAAHSDYIYTLVRTGPEGERHRNLTLLLIPPSTPGVTIELINGMGLKGFPTTDVTFSDVELPLDAIVGGEAGWNHAWPMVVGSGLDVEKLEVAAMAIGIGQAALDDAWAYAGERQQFGKAIGNYQSIQHKLADMKTQLHGARLMLYHAAHLANEHRPCSGETSMAKLFATEAGKAIALECQTIFGAYGYVKDFDVERYVRDALGLPIIGGSSAIQRNNIYKWMARQ